ncbi:glycosyltransferase [bacterium]|nr:MAG: glycosyltransferase [bacterium]
MKVIFVTREGYDLAGARIRCYNFSQELLKRGMNTEVLSFSDTLGAKDGARESELGVSEKIKYNYEAFRRLSGSKGAIFILQRFNYHSFAPFLASFFNKNKIVLDLDDWEMRENPKYYLGFYPSSKAHYFTRAIARRSLFCIGASRFLQGFLRQFNKNIFYIPSGVDTGVFKPAVKTSAPDKIVISWLGTFHRKEYIENIKFAAGCFSSLRKKYPHIYFEITGDGIYEHDLKDMVSLNNDDHITLRDWISPHEVPAYLSGIHIGILPVVGDTKFNRAKSPTKLFEYMSMGLPTVSTAIGEAENIIKDRENGFLAETREEFIEKIGMLIENAGLRQDIGKKARQTVEEDYSLEVLGRRLHEILKKYS